MLILSIRNLYYPIKKFSEVSHDLHTITKALHGKNFSSSVDQVESSAANLQKGRKVVWVNYAASPLPTVAPFSFKFEARCCASSMNYAGPSPMRLAPFRIAEILSSPRYIPLPHSNTNSHATEFQILHLHFQMCNSQMTNFIYIDDKYLTHLT